MLTLSNTLNHISEAFIVLFQNASPIFLVVAAADLQGIGITLAALSLAGPSLDRHVTAPASGD